MDMNGNLFFHEWRPFVAFKQQPKIHNNTETGNNSNNTGLALVILNQPITKNFDLKLIQLWRNSSVSFCVDGGINQLFAWQKRMRQLTTTTQLTLSEIRTFEILQGYFPDYICGDLDSVDSEILSFYESKGSKRIQLNNQELTDFEKTLRFAVTCIRQVSGCGGQRSGEEVCQSHIDPELLLTNSTIKSNNQFSLIEAIKCAELKAVNFDQIYVVCDFGGRVDHSISNLNSLYTKCLAPLETYILSSESITFLLKKGVNVIYADSDLFSVPPMGGYCGFFPFGQEAIVSTFGLKWNVHSKRMSFGGVVSSSNEFSGVVSEEEVEFIARGNFAGKIDVKRMHVIIQTDQQLIWTMSIK